MIRKASKQRFLATILCSVILFVFLGLVGMAVAMQGDEHSSMHGCPYMVDTKSFCGMSADEHQGVFISLSQALIKRISDIIALLFALLIAFVVVLASIFKPLHAPPDLASQLYARRIPDKDGFRYLPLLFSQGILHSKAW
jgi:uncharacterized membrane protein YhaH (DUF805 family)